MSNKNPWLGLASYEEPKNNGDDYLFCGRDEETLNMVRLIDNNLFVTLYGSSGIGKTSLLRAGVIPILRKKDYFPLYLRLSQEPKEISYAEAIVRKIEACCLTKERIIAANQYKSEDINYLWHYFATTRFLNNNREVYPVIILDQFEEVFRGKDKEKAELLLKQIYLLLNDALDMPDEDGYSADTNYRFVASIREDYLFVLEDSIDENALNLYKDNRYRLRPMKPEQAELVVKIPGKDCIEKSDQDIIADSFISMVTSTKQNGIDTLLLSLVCSKTYDKKKGDKICISDLDMWKDLETIINNNDSNSNGWWKNPMEVYYQDAINDLEDDQVEYIQQYLIRDDGSRKQLAIDEVKSFFGENRYLQLLHGKNRLLGTCDENRVELLHDQLAFAVYKSKQAKEAKERIKKQRQKQIRSYSTALFFIALLGFITLFIWQRAHLIKLMESQSRSVADKACNIAKEGDFYTAQRVLLEALPKTEENIFKRFLLPQQHLLLETENAFRYLFQYNNIILKEHRAAKWAFLSPGENQIISASEDSLYIWDAYDGQLSERRVLQKETEEYKNYISSAVYSPDGKQKLSPSMDSIRICDAETGHLLQTLLGHSGPVNTAIFSHDGKHIVSASEDKTVKIWDAETGHLLQTLQGHSGPVNTAIFSHDGKYIVSASEDKTVRIWEIDLPKIIVDKTDMFYSCIFSPDNNFVVSVSIDTISSYSPKHLLKIWDVKKGSLIKTQELGNKTIQELSFKKELSKQDIIYVIRVDELDSSWVSSAFNPNDSTIGNISFRHEKRDNNNKMNSDYLSIDGFQTKPQTTKGNTKGKYTSNSMDTINNKNTNNVISSTELVEISEWESTNLTVMKNKFDLICLVKDTTGQIIDTIKCAGHTDQISHVGFSRDGKLIVSTSHDKTIRVWDAKSGQLIRTYLGHNSIVNFADFSSDGKQIVSASNDGTIRIWESPNPPTFSKELIGQNCKRFNDRLTPAERKKYLWE